MYIMEIKKTLNIVKNNQLNIEAIESRELGIKN